MFGIESAKYVNSDDLEDDDVAVSDPSAFQPDDPHARPYVDVKRLSKVSCCCCYSTNYCS